MPYTIQIDKLGAVGPDGLTPLDLTNPLVTRTQANDRIIITIPDGIAFGNFDPGEIVGLNNVPYMLLSATMKSSLFMFTNGTVALSGPQAPGGAFLTRKNLLLLPDISLGAIFLGSALVPRDHILRFTSTDAGPYTIITTLEPVRNVGLVAAYTAGRRD